LKGGANLIVADLAENVNFPRNHAHELPNKHGKRLGAGGTPPKDRDVVRAAVKGR